MSLPLDNDWGYHLRQEFEEAYYAALQAKLAEEYREHIVYPREEHIFQALRWTSYEDTKVVLLGQDPYHGAGQAQGLSFSVPEGVRVPPSLRNIFKELREDLAIPIASHGNLESWAQQGVLLLNTVLTVREGEANSHKKLGWETFTDRIVTLLNERDRPLVFVLWGRHAHQKGSFIDKSKHLVIESAHPSPLSAHNGFFGSRPFSKVNEFLLSTGQKEVNWCLPERLLGE